MTKASATTMLQYIKLLSQKQLDILFAENPNFKSITESGYSRNSRNEIEYRKTLRARALDEDVLKMNFVAISLFTFIREHSIGGRGW